MAPFGKVHAAMHNAGDRVKSGLAWANHRYQQGVGLAQRINDYYHTGKKVAGLMMPVLDRVHPAIAHRVMGGIGALDQLRDMGISKHQEVMDKIKHNASIVRDMRDAVAPLQPYMTSSGWSPSRRPHPC